MSHLFMRRPSLTDLPESAPLPKDAVVRTLAAADLKQVAEVLSAAFSDPEWNETSVERELVDPPDVITTHVIEVGARVVATASARLLPQIYPGSGYVHWVAARPDYKGRRLGYNICLVVLHEFVSRSCIDAVLETHDFRLPAIQTYLNLGFEPEIREEDQIARWANVRQKLAAPRPD